MAFSHCWGTSVPGQKPSHCTTSKNIKSRQRGFNLAELPKNFRDAIEVTRQLGIQYIWIDSLCIIQGPDGDWEKECDKMEQVFASAYCTIAATSAASSDAGFLHLYKDLTHEQAWIQVSHTPQQHFYLSTNLANFEQDVNNASHVVNVEEPVMAPLNRRAWVLQERLLSPRTIHFARNQVYGECGNGIYAGGATFLGWYVHMLRLVANTR